MSRWKHYGGVAVRDGARVIISEVPTGTTEIPGDRTDNPGSATVKPKRDTISNKWSNWGSNNNLPADRRAKVMQSTVAPRAIKTRMAVHYGGGIYTYKREQIEVNGELKIVKRITRFDEFEKFARKNNLPFTWKRIIMDYEHFANAFVQMVTSRDRKLITNIFHQQATHTRVSRMDDLGRIKECYLSYNWPQPAENEMRTLPLVNPLEQLQAKKFVMQIEDPMPGYDYYGLATWDGVEQSGWLDIAAIVPKLKLAVLKNQISIKYHVHVPASFWNTLYPNWDSLTPAQQLSNKNSFYDSINLFLTDIDNNGKSFFSEFATTPDGKPIEGFKIEVIDNKLKDGQLLPDSFGANTEILWAIGVNPVLIGMVPSGSMGAGSGSNIREAFHTLQSLMAFDREATLAPLRFIRDYNGWDPEMEFGYLDIQTWQTLNQSKDKGQEAPDGTS